MTEQDVRDAILKGGKPLVQAAEILGPRLKDRKLTDEEQEIVRKHFKGEEDRPSRYRYDKPDHLKKVRGVPKMWYKPLTRSDGRPDVLS